MSFFKKIIGLFNSTDNHKEIEWSVDYKENTIVIKSSENLTEIGNLNDLIQMYNMDIAHNSEITISYDDIYDFYYDENDNRIDLYKEFKLPDMFNGYFKVENRNNFIVDKEVFYSFTFKGPEGDYSIKSGNILSLELNNEFKLMNKKLYELVKKVSEYNQDESKRSDEAYQFEMLQIIKDYSNDIDVILNQRLREEESPIIIDKLKIDFKDNGEVLEIIPQFHNDNEINKKIIDNIDAYDDIKGVYSAKVNGKKVRCVIKNKKTLETVVRNRINKNEDRLNVLSGKSELFEDENIDITAFGPRVTGIGYLTYKNSSSTVKTNDLNWLDNGVDYPFIEGSNINGDYECITLTPKDLIKFQSKLVNMNIDNEEVCEIEILSDKGNVNKFIMTKDNIKNEIEKIRSRIKYPTEINKIKDIEELMSIADDYSSEEYIPFKGMYIDKGAIDIKEQLESQLININKKAEEKKKETKGKKTLLIAENIDEDLYKEQDTFNNIKREVEECQGLKAGIKLFEYQNECAGKLQNLYLDSKVNGFLLCDDMGLGKTLQLLAFLSWLKDKDMIKPSLIVAPSSLLNNWDSSENGEIQKFFKEGYFKTTKIVGRVSKDEVEKLKENDIVFITYDSLRINNIALGKINWKVMICDEAQKIKSTKTQVTLAAKAQNADFKIVCSATPIENSLEDLWTLVDYSKPGLLGSLKDFKKEYISKNKNMDNVNLQEMNDKLYSIISNFYLRREKDVLPKSLPKKLIKVYRVKPSTDEIELLERVKSTEEQTLVAIQKMLAICNHVDLLSNEPILDQNVEMLISKSSKLKVLKDILTNIKIKDEKVIIFSRLKRAQLILLKSIKYWFNIESYIVNGDVTNLDKRTNIINKFRNDKGFSVIILSPDVAGFGITITEANHVIHYTRMWNPAKEDQATDRAYRIGQTKDVIVHYPIISYEENCTKEYSSVNDYVQDNLKVPNHMLSPDEKLNILLARKKDMLLNFFLAAGNGDISTIDFLSLEDTDKKRNNILIGDVVNKIIDPFEFEALIAVLFEKLGYTSYLTSRSNDKGADVICVNNEEIIFIQCKQTNSKIGESVIKEIDFAKSMYSGNIKGRKIKEYIVTTSDDIKESLRSQKLVEIIDLTRLAKLLETNKIFKDEVNIKELERYSYEVLRRKI